MPARDPRPAPSLWDALARPLTRANATPASRQAAERTEPTAAEVMRLALGQYVPAGAQWNADEVASRLGVHWIRVRPRVSQLLHAGLLRVVRTVQGDATSPPVQRESANHNPADVLEITAAGLLAWHRPGPVLPPPGPKGTAR